MLENAQLQEMQYPVEQLPPTARYRPILPGLPESGERLTHHHERGHRDLPPPGALQPTQPHRHAVRRFLKGMRLARKHLVVRVPRCKPSSHHRR